MNRADQLELALRQIMSSVANPKARAIAQNALDLDFPWPDEVAYNAPEDYAIARQWMDVHARADETVFVKGRPVMAVYYEPVANHYQQARRLFREFAERLRVAFEADWV